MARALAGACARASPKPVAFFARKGADCLGKFAGDAERTLRLLFEEAERRAPAIIFLDELDGLAPARAVREGGTDQTYASLVSTLLSLMDGLKDRGHVIVIGATNRPDSIDPALRRPGRFDREVLLGLPSIAAREAILHIHTHRWPSPPHQNLLQDLAKATEGFAGADLQALCCAAVLAAVQRQASHLTSDGALLQPSPGVDRIEPVILENMPDAEGVSSRDDGRRSDPALTKDAGLPIGAATTGENRPCLTEGADLAGASVEGGEAPPAPLLPAAAIGEICSQIREGSHAAATSVDGRDPLPEPWQHAAVEPRAGRTAIPDDLQVRAHDWRTALSRAPKPCSLRSALPICHAPLAHVPQNASPAFLRCLAQLLGHAHRCLVPMAPAVQPLAQSAAKLDAAWAGGPTGISEAEQLQQKFEGQLTEALQAVSMPSLAAGSQRDADDAEDGFDDEGEPGVHPYQSDGASANSGHAGCHMLLTGSSAAERQALASVLLTLLGSGEKGRVSSISLPLLLLEGNGDPLHGLLKLLPNICQRDNGSDPFLLHIPEFDAWATVALPGKPMEPPAPEANFGVPISAAAGAIPLLLKSGTTAGPPGHLQLPREAPQSDAAPQARSSATPAFTSLAACLQIGKQALAQTHRFMEGTAPCDCQAEVATESVPAPAWATFVQLLSQSQMVQRRGVVLLATSQTPMDELPDAVCKVFEPQQSMDGGKGCGVAVQLPNACLAPVLELPRMPAPGAKAQRNSVPAPRERHAAESPGQPKQPLHHPAASGAGQHELNGKEQEEARLLSNQVQQALGRAGSHLAADPRTCFLQKAASRSRSRTQAAAGEALMRVAEATAKGQTPDLEAYQAALRHALRGFLRRPGLVAQRTRQHSIYTVHVHSLRHNAACACASALVDEAEEWCHLMSMHYNGSA
ncbi:hypothetical protein WJX84_007261 [Apatococcus fuscideae]|uniref:Uncharacterized protein n=1 Tax=Apatococcus fuscideae TaxID=2026836 RepID=A0AAW1TKY7_9CHLO